MIFFYRFFFLTVCCILALTSFLNSEEIADTQVDFTSSNLPIVVIDTNGQQIPDEPKLDAHMGIIYNGPGQRNTVTDPFNDYDGLIGIEMRGNASQMFPKKPYLLETRDEMGDNNNVSLIGMPKENDWILRAAYIDKTLLRDVIAYEMSRRMGRWASRSRHVELILNGEYRGVYVLVESIKPDKNRVDIVRMEPTDVSGDAVTGGYIYDIAQSENDFGERRQLKYPKADEVQPEQIEYIREYDDNFRHVMEQSYYADPERGYPAWIDVGFFIDEILIQEATKNSDAYGWSAHFHKDRNDKLRAGPAWDFDQALSNSTFNDGPNYSEWIIEKSEYDNHLRENYPPFWIKLFREPNFKKQLALRWFALRQTVWATTEVMELIDSTATFLDEAQARNFEKWPILGEELWRSTPGWDERDTYEKEVNNVKTFLNNRLNWMDSQLRRYVEDQPQPVDGLVLHYDFNEMSGGIVQDKSGLYNDGVFQGEPQWTDGKFGGGVSLDGVNDFIDCGNPDDLDITSQITITAWIKQRDAGNGEHNPWITKGDHSFALKHYSENAYEFFIYDDGWRVVRAPVNESHNNHWYHFAGTFDGSALVFYINGERIAEEPYSGSINPSDFPINIGRNAEASDRFWDGVIDELRIYNIALDDEQIFAIFNDTAQVSDDHPGLVDNLKLAQNYPNPFNGKTTIDFELAAAQHINLSIYDLLGRHVRTMIDANTVAGRHSITFSADELPSGLYIYQLKSKRSIQTRKMLLLN